ncbi:MAG: ABC transporter permease [Synechococcales cyanobacterium K44_A2020_017]|uniref:ABC transporter permease n=1 Tax=Leptolyngbya sp. CCY15150 TaxID=2767772 RepID=UPI00194F13F1|nr:ABC transporter permease [Leptolyngbya sp. CCY15150]MBF2089879.1 ABC transporter permease [Synechococcales cyanobacterium K32_A2020_035]MBF2096101.1 ABC transporter permease [Synechococcales cyanobacterium K44_A2020_017]
MTAIKLSARPTRSINLLSLVGWLYLGGMYLFLMLPILTLVIFSFENSRFPTLPWTGWTLSWYGDLFRDGRLIQSLGYSLWISPAAAAAATVLGFCAAYVLNRFQFLGKKLLSIVLIIPIIIPPLILGVAFLGLLSGLQLQGKLISIFLTHVVILIPTAIALIGLRLSQMPKDLEEAAWNLGATEWQALWRVVLPWSIPGIAGAWLLAFTFSFDEFVIAWFVSGFQQTLPVAIYTFLGANLTPALNAIGTLIFLISICLLVGVELLLIPILLGQRRSS